MQTPTATAPGADSSRSGRLTAALGAAVLVVAAIFAFQSLYPHWYAIFKVVHVMIAVFWVGGGLTITVLGLRAERLSDPNEIVTVARQAGFVGEKLFAPAGLVVFLMGIAMMLHTNWGWGKFWVDAGLVGYVATFATGVGVLSPLGKRIGELASTKGPTDPETQAAIRKILLIARFDVAVLLLVVADMVTKPFS